MGGSVLGVPNGTGYMWGVVCSWYSMEQGTCGSSVLGVPYGAGYRWGVVC